MRIFRTLLAVAALAASVPHVALAQSTCSNIFRYDVVPTVGQWQQCLGTKQDMLGFTALNQAGGTMTGRLVTTPSTTYRSGFSIAPGVPPSSPVDGDVWVTVGGVYVQIAGSTVGPLTATGSSIPSVVQGDMLYGSGPGALSALTKSAAGTRYLSNTGTSNNPAWSQVDLSSGVTNQLPLSNIAAGTQDTALGYFGSTAVSAAALPDCAGALVYSTSTHAFGCNASGVFISGTPTANQVPQWTNSTTVKGVDLGSLMNPGPGVSITSGTNPTISMTSGTIVGSARGQYTANAALTVGIPVDDTIPQITEGTQIISVVYTPVVSTSTLRLTFTGQVTSNGANNVVCAIFNGSSNAVGAEVVNVAAGQDFKYTMAFNASYAPGSTSSQTISVRCGAGAGNVYLNGTSGSRLLGGASAAVLEIREVL